MTLLREKIKNNKLLFMVILTYLALLIFMPGKAIKSFQNSLYYVKEMLMIMPVILLLTSLITAWVPKKTIENNFGKNSGFRGSIYSFLLGSFSAGPIYAAFPICKTLLKKGASISNIVIILSTWAVIKVPMLLNETKFLGFQFMALRWVFTTISIFIMGFIISKMIKKEEIPMGSEKNIAEGECIHINEDYCIGCGICAKIAPNIFEIYNKKAKAIRNDQRAEETGVIKEVIEKCPSKAIEYFRK